MAYCGILETLMEIDGKPVDFSRIDEGIIIAGDEEYDAEEFISDEDRLDLFNDMALRSKDDLLEDIDELIEEIGKEAETGAKYSATFYRKYNELMEQFRHVVEKSAFPGELEDWWSYTYEVGESGVTLKLEHTGSYDVCKDDTILTHVDTSFHLLTVRTKLLTVEQYAQAYDVTTTTVRQWIRRGKIRSAVKQGSEWRIPELAEIMERGYRDGNYERLEELTDLPQEYAFLNDYVYIDIRQDKEDKTRYDVLFSMKFDPLVVPREEWGQYHRTVRMDRKEREKFELYLISSSFVRASDTYITGRG